MVSQTKQIKFLITFVLVTVTLCLVQVPTSSEGLWLFQDILSNQTAAQLLESSSKLSQDLQDSVKQQQPTKLGSQQTTQTTSNNYDGFSIGGIRPSNIASILNTVSETGFSYFNVHDQCRSRTACDVGYTLYKKLNFIHNWIIRASVRTLIDSNNVYALSWNNGMMGKNCTSIYPSCNQSPMDSIMTFLVDNV